jgi:hypothetical protein
MILRKYAKLETIKTLKNTSDKATKSLPGEIFQCSSGYNYISYLNLELEKNEV